MINNPKRYITKPSRESLIETKLNDLYRLISEYQNFFDIDCNQYFNLDIIKSNITNAHSYFTDVLREVAIDNKKYNIEI